MHNITLNLNSDLFRWIEANRGNQSRAAFVVAKMKEIMHDTLPQGEIHTKGNNDNHIINGAFDAPEQV